MLFIPFPTFFDSNPPPSSFSTSPRFVMFEVVDDFDVLAEEVERQMSIIEGGHLTKKPRRQNEFLKNANFHRAPGKNHAYHIQQPR